MNGNHTRLYLICATDIFDCETDPSSGVPLMSQYRDELWFFGGGSVAIDCQTLEWELGREATLVGGVVMVVRSERATSMLFA